MGSEPRSDRYQPVLENGQWLVVDTSRKAGPSGAAFPVVMTARFMAEAEVEACALNAAYERGVREEREAEGAKSCETCGRNTGPETGLCPSSKCPRCRRNDPMEDYWISRTEAASPPVQGDGKGGA